MLIKLYVNQNDTVKDLKDMIYRKHFPIPPSHQALCYAGEQLVDGKCLSADDIKPRSILILCVVLRVSDACIVVPVYLLQPL